jgi:hypothetical protein
MTIYNFKSGKDMITLDLRTQQIRYLKDYKNHGEILFYPLGRDDVEAYEYLFKKDKKLFLKSLREDVYTAFGKKIKSLKIVK